MSYSEKKAILWFSTHSLREIEKGGEGNIPKTNLPPSYGVSGGPRMMAIHLLYVSSDGREMVLSVNKEGGMNGRGIMTTILPYLRASILNQSRGSEVSSHIPSSADLSMPYLQSCVLVVAGGA